MRPFRVHGDERVAEELVVEVVKVGVCRPPRGVHLQIPV